MEEPEIIIRPMQRQDIRRVHEIEQTSFSSPWSFNALRSELTNKVAYYSVIEVDESIVGYAGMWILYDEAHITNIAIDKPNRGCGYSRRLMLHMLEIAKRLGAEKMTLEVRRSNEVAKALYSSLGFHQNGVRRGYYADTKEDALILWVDIDNNC